MNTRAVSGGYGLCSEFGNQKVLGYAEARPGDPFPKPGVGLLVRPNRSDYSFFHDYEIAQSFPVEVDCTEDWARFTVEPLDCRGFAFRETRTIQLASNTLAMSIRFENTGRQAIHTHEYCHNFLGIDRQPISPAYCLRFAAPVKFKKLLTILRPLLHATAAQNRPRFHPGHAAEADDEAGRAGQREKRSHLEYYRRPAVFRPSGQFPFNR